MLQKVGVRGTFIEQQKTQVGRGGEERDSEEDTGSLGTGVRDRCDPPDGMRGTTLNH